MEIKTLAPFLVWTVTMLMTTDPIRAQQVTACAPNCTYAAVGDRVRVPWNCAQYAVCVDLHGDGFLYPSDPVDCPEGEYFEPSHDIPRCDPAEGADPGFCGELCDPCEVLCTVAGELSPDPVNCGVYHVCVGPGSFATVPCDSGANYFYDFVNGECQSDISRCFEQFCSVCNVHCIEEGNIPDPHDITKFYYCNPPQLVHGTCPPGECFDENTNTCSGSATCSQICLT